MDKDDLVNSFHGALNEMYRWRMKQVLKHEVVGSEDEARTLAEQQINELTNINFLEELLENINNG